MALAIAAIAIVGVGGSVVVFWKAFLVQYHLCYLLWREPSAVVDLLQQDESTVEYRAARRFLGLRPGKKALLREYLKIVGDGTELHGDGRVIESFRCTSGVHSGSSGARVAVDRIAWGPALPLGSSRRGMRPVKDHQRALTVLENLQTIEGEDLTLAEFPGLRFTVLPSDRAGESAWMPDHHIRYLTSVAQPPPRLVCRIRCLDHLAVQTLLDALDDPIEHVRIFAIEALVRMDCAHDEVIAALEKVAATNDVERVRARHTALDALEKLRRSRRLETQESNR